jgi:transcriptional regulator with XRE-family HTH domain
MKGGIYINNIGKSIKKLREARNISQHDFSEMCDCSESHISNIERNQTSFSTKSFIKAVNVLKVPMNLVLEEEFIYNEDVRKKYMEIVDKYEIEKSLCVLRCIKLVEDEITKFNELKKEKDSKDIDFNKVGNRIKTLRKEKNITVATMAKYLGVNEKSYKNIESNNSCASITKYLKIAKKFEVPLDYIFEDSIINKEYILSHYIEDIYKKDRMDIKRTESVSKLFVQIMDILDKSQK